MTIEKLKSLIQDVLWAIPDNFRCYEFTRFLRTAFSDQGINFEVKDGLALYYPLTFFQEAKRRNCQLMLQKKDMEESVRAARWAYRIGKKKVFPRENISWRIGVYHSWGILPKEKYLIDHHRMINPRELRLLPSVLQKFPILQEIEVRNFLRIIPLKEVPSPTIYFLGDVIYYETAEQIGDEIRYSGINYSTKLRYM